MVVTGFGKGLKEREIRESSRSLPSRVLVLRPPKWKLTHEPVYLALRSAEMSTQPTEQRQVIFD